MKITQVFNINKFKVSMAILGFIVGSGLTNAAYGVGDDPLLSPEAAAGKHAVFEFDTLNKLKTKLKKILQASIPIPVCGNPVQECTLSNAMKIGQNSPTDGTSYHKMATVYWMWSALISAKTLSTMPFMVKVTTPMSCTQIPGLTLKFIGSKCRRVAYD